MSTILLGGTQANPTRLNSLGQSPMVTGQWRKMWSINSPFPLQKMHHWGQRDLSGLLNCNLSLVFTFTCATNQARALTFEGAFELHKNLVERNKIGFETFDKTKKKDFIENKSDDDKYHALESTKEWEKSSELRKDINLLRRSISESIRLRRKLKFQDSGNDLPMTFETVRFFTEITL